MQLLDVTMRDGGFETVRPSSPSPSLGELRTLFEDLRADREDAASDSEDEGGGGEWQQSSRGIRTKPISKARKRAEKCSAIFWGTSASGGSVAVLVDVVRPVGYIRVHDAWRSDAGASALARALISRIDGAADDVRVTFRKHRRLWGWTPPASPRTTSRWCSRRDTSPAPRWRSSCSARRSSAPSGSLASSGWCPRGGPSSAVPCSY